MELCWQIESNWQRTAFLTLGSLLQLSFRTIDLKALKRFAFKLNCSKWKTRCTRNHYKWFTVNFYSQTFSILHVIPILRRDLLVEWRGSQSKLFILLVKHNFKGYFSGFLWFCNQIGFQFLWSEFQFHCFMLFSVDFCGISLKPIIVYIWAIWLCFI